MNPTITSNVQVINCEIYALFFTCILKKCFVAIDLMADLEIENIKSVTKSVANISYVEQINI